MGIGQILESLRTPALRVGPCPQFLVEEIADADHSQRHAVEQNLARSRDGSSQRGIVRELNWRTVDPGPVLGVFAGPSELKACSRQGRSRKRDSIENRDLDVESRARLLLMHLKREASDDGVGNMLLHQNSAEREEHRFLAPVHFSPHPVPLAIQ